MTPFTLRLTAGTVNVPSPLNSMTSLIAFGTATPETMLKPVAANMYDPRRVRSLQLLPSGTGKPLARIRTMEEIVARELSTPSQSTALLTAFALLALLLAALGIYGVLLLRDATHERDRRMALGATSGEIMRSFGRRGLGVTFTGLAIGVVPAAIAARLMSTLLYGFRPDYIATVAIVSVVLMCVATLACVVPARRAARIDPMIALRQE